MKYVIDSETYEKHIRDEVHLYGLLHQLFQYGSQRRKLRRLQFGKIIPVTERQVASGNEPVVKLFLRDLAVVL